ncbi:hypothetical protein MKW98_027256 [Papaver atlanticum]|uniref:Uncharacterized protein n=1 Tax=Papaver atlanticum TaxID=357466 RepID=A0AAD4XJZ2_9MAGN|nr:hypothetical protein MKW98_027256 [Papaver atlanticum]
MSDQNPMLANVTPASAYAHPGGIEEMGVTRDGTISAVLPYNKGSVVHYLVIHLQFLGLVKLLEEQSIHVFYPWMKLWRDADDVFDALVILTSAVPKLKPGFDPAKG